MTNDEIHNVYKLHTLCRVSHQIEFNIGHVCAALVRLEPTNL